MQPDEDGNTHCVQYAQTMSEIKNKAKRLYVGKAMYMKGRSVVPDEDKEKFFMIYVEGKDAPVKKHLTYASAMHEAHRLADLGECPYVLESISSVRPKKSDEQQFHPTITHNATTDMGVRITNINPNATTTVIQADAADVADNIMAAPMFNIEDDDGIPKKKQRKRIAPTPTKVVIKNK